MTEILFLQPSDKLDKALFNSLCDFVSEERKQKASRQRHDIDKKLCLYAELLARYAACRLLQISNEEIKFKKGTHGKPYIQNFPDFHFSISHTKNAVAVAVSAEEVGVDIEKIKNPNFKIAKRFFTENEQNAIFSAKQPNHEFFKIWTQKEAFIKHSGRGFSQSLSSFCTFDSNITPTLKTFILQEYILSVCELKLCHAETKLTVISENKLEKFFLESDIDFRN